MDLYNYVAMEHVVVDDIMAHDCMLLYVDDVVAVVVVDISFVVSVNYIDIVVDLVGGVVAELVFVSPFLSWQTHM